MTAEEAGQETVTATASILAVADMGLFALKQQEESLTVTRSACPRAVPEDSAVWNVMQEWKNGKL